MRSRATKLCARCTWPASTCGPAVPCAFLPVGLISYPGCRRQRRRLHFPGPATAQPRRRRVAGCSGRSRRPFRAIAMGDEVDTHDERGLPTATAPTTTSASSVYPPPTALRRPRPAMWLTAVVGAPDNLNATLVLVDHTSGPDWGAGLIEDGGRHQVPVLVHIFQCLIRISSP